MEGDREGIVKVRSNMFGIYIFLNLPSMICEIICR